MDVVHSKTALGKPLKHTLWLSVAVNATQFRQPIEIAEMRDIS